MARHARRLTNAKCGHCRNFSDRLLPEAAAPDLARPTSCYWRRHGLPLPLGASWWRLAMVERAGNRRAGRLKDHNAASLHAALDHALRRDAVLCADGDAAFATFTRARGVTHHTIPAKRGPRVVHGAFHIQTVNNLHAALKDFLRPFRGPATRYLDAYLTWFTATQHPENPCNAIIAA